MLKLNGCNVDVAAAVVNKTDGNTSTLTGMECKLLAYLAERPGQAVSKQVLLTEVWGYREGLRTRAVDSCVVRLRQKIEQDASEPDHLITVYGQGYRLDLPNGRSAHGHTLQRSLAKGGGLELFAATNQDGAQVAILFGPEEVLQDVVVLHDIIDHPLVPKRVAGEPNDGWIALGCPIRCTLVEIWDRLATNDVVFPYEAGAFVGLQMMDLLVHCQSLIDPRDGGPLSMGDFSWSCMWVNQDGGISYVGWGSTLGAPLSSGSAHRHEQAPEVGWGHRPDASSDMAACLQLFDATPIEERHAPPALTRILSGQPLPEDAEVAQLLLPMKAAIKAPRGARPSSMRDVRECYRAVWGALGLTVDEASWTKALSATLA
jgi:DNA-binding winged helix-turn-helix (wHTH) protein